VVVPSDDLKHAVCGQHFELLLLLLLLLLLQ
jgi:hypothetical protein